MKKMDWLDMVSLLVIVTGIISIVIISFEYTGEAGNNTDRSAVMNRQVTGESLVPPEKTKMISDLIAQNNIKKAEAVLGEMLEKYPYEGGMHMLKGDIMMRKQDPVSAIYSYRTAVEFNTDYVDKKTPLFQGRKIKVAIDEAKNIIESELIKNSDNKDMKKAKKTVYYLLRSLAGSCG